MSNPLAIAAATATLRHLLQEGFKQAAGANDPIIDDVQDTEVTIQPLDKARGSNTKNQLNLFLYQIQRNAAWVNTGPSQQGRSGEAGFLAPLPLNLWYLLTPFGRNDDSDNSAQPFGHHLLGKAMSILNDHTVLGAEDIHAATQSILPASDLEHQIERIRITLQTLSVEEINRLWTGFATPYRLSAAYEVAVTIIESNRPAKTPLPVLRRGSEDRGNRVLASPPPLLEKALPPHPFATARLGDDIALRGRQLNNGGFAIRFSNLRLPTPNDLDPKAGGTVTELNVHLANLTEDPKAFTKWVPGIYTVSLVFNAPDIPSWTTNEGAVLMALAPVIKVSPKRAPAGDITLQITCAPRLRDEQKQQVFLLFGERCAPIPVQSLVNPPQITQPTTLTFLVPMANPGIYKVRLRVDGVDSLPVTLAGTPPIMAFDPLQEVTVT